MTPPPTRVGECRCGRVRLRATAAPLITSACHCRGCQRMTASAFLLSALLPSDAFEVAGATRIGGLHGPEQHHHHCDHCCSWLFTRIEGMPEFVNLRATMFDAPDWCVPFLETARDEALPWVATPAIRSFGGLPPADLYPELMAEFAAHA
ncbi:GFA family protein [Jannaschia ovalis]